VTVTHHAGRTRAVTATGRCDKWKNQIGATLVVNNAEKAIAARK
jgi:hypothetical protein